MLVTAAPPSATRRTERKDPVRVLYCETNVDGTIGGSYYSLLYLVKNLDRRRYLPTVVFYRAHGLLDAFREAGIQTIVWPAAGRFSFGASLPASARWCRPPIIAAQRSLNAVRAFALPALERARFLQQHRIDIVHLNNSILYNHDWVLAARTTGRRCVSHERGINRTYPRSARFWGRQLDAILCISDAVRSTMVNAGVDPGNLHTVHNGFDPDEVHHRVPGREIRASLGIAPGDDVVVMVGNLKAWKGQDTLVRAVDLVRRERPSVRCVLVGATARADQGFENELRQLVTSQGLEHHVVFAGFQQNVPDFIAVSDAVVHASVEPEPFGRVILEAMACRKPVVATRAGGVPEIVEDGQSGLLYPPGDVSALARSILRILDDPSEARRMGDAGHRRLMERFHIDRNIEATVGIYERLLAGTR